MGPFIGFLLLVSILVIFLPLNSKKALSLIIILLVSGFTGYHSIIAIYKGIVVHFPLPYFGDSAIVFDSLSAFFILVINLTAITSIIYANSYLKGIIEKKSKAEASLHYLAFILLYFSMLLLCLLHNGFLFLLAWELMTISSFILVIFDAQDKQILKTGINYLIQMHVGLLFIMVGFLVVEKHTGILGFDGLSKYFEHTNNIPLFLIFFIGFGIKAGFVPFHTWLPEAHPAAPSHVSGFMSGVMIKMGIYGILRVATSLQSNFIEIGTIVLIVSVLTGVYGVMFAIVQHDIKRLLAYHSIENIGIIGIGIGIALIGFGTTNTLLIVLGLAGALLHVLNHSLFKSLLFFASGAVYKITHTRNIEQLGGIIHRMPKTSLLFLLGALSICGLPPFNGFISEYLIYSGLFTGIHSYSPFQVVVFLSSIIGLTLIGGLAIFCFTKVFGIAFLGEPRTKFEAHEAEAPMLFSKYIIGFFIIIIGLFPVFFVKPIAAVVVNSFTLNGEHLYSPICFCNLITISNVGGIFVLLTLAMLLLRYLLMKRKQITLGPTWGCAYTAGDSTHQYTSTSFSADYAKISKFIIKTERHYEPIQEEEIFPTVKKFGVHRIDSIKKHIIDKNAELLVALLRRMARLQTGKMQHYVLYALLLLILLLALTIFNFI
jgi:formate hydrogenlyase subunit 3/multisubunit Na+/H+ antiporter MnhD subunit